MNVRFLLMVPGIGYCKAAEREFSAVPRVGDTVILDDKEERVRQVDKVTWDLFGTGVVCVYLRGN